MREESNKLIKIKCMLDKTKFTIKPTGYETGAIQNRLESAQNEITLQELASHIIQGCTFKPALLNGRSCDTWLSQQLFALDFDNDVIYFNSDGKKIHLKKLKGFNKDDLILNPEDIASKYNLTIKDNRTCIDEQLSRCEDFSIYPAFCYTSFSHTDDKHKFRFVFCTDNVITDPIVRCKIQYTLMNIFDKSDDSTKDAARLFYGGYKLFSDNYTLIKADDVIEKYYISDYDDEIYRMVSMIDPENNEIKGFSRKEGLDNNYPTDKEPSLLSNPPKTPSSDSNAKYYNIKAIRNRDVEYLKSKLQFPKVVVVNNQEYMDYICKIDLGKLLEIKYPHKFKCLFHDDKNPSTSIFVHKSGHFLYKCHSAGCGRVYNILGIIEKLGGFKSRPKAHKFIREIFNVEFTESEFQKEQKEILMENIMFLTSGEFRKQCPSAYSNISRNLEYLVKLHRLAMDNVKNENLTDEEGAVAFFASASYLCKVFDMSPYSIDKIFEKNVQLAYHYLINKLSESEIPERMLKRSKAISAKKGNKKNVNVYSIPSYVQDKIEDIEQQGINWKDNKYTMKGISREMFYRAEGKEVANRIYPQYKQIEINGEVVDRTTSKTSDERTNNIVKAIFDIIKDKQYATERDVVNYLSDIYRYITTEEQIKKSLKEILNTYGLQRLRANKELKEKFGIEGSGYPNIIIKNEA